MCAMHLDGVAIEIYSCKVMRGNVWTSSERLLLITSGAFSDLHTITRNRYDVH